MTRDVKNIAILVGDNAYATTAHFSKALAKAFKRRKVDVRLYYVGKGRFYKALHEMMAAPPDMTLSFSDIKMGEKPLSQLWTIPHFTYLIDPPIYYSHHVNSPNAYVSTVDNNDLAWMQKRGSAHFCFLPHGVEKDLFALPQQKPEYDIVMIGTLIDIERVKKSWQKKFSRQEIDILEEAALKVLSPQGISIYEALVLSGAKENLLLLHFELDLYVGGKERIDLVRACEGLNLHIFGKGAWEKFFPKRNISSSIPFKKTIDVMRRSKIVLNTSARFKHGSHERIFYALGAHALPVTGENPFFDKYGEAIVTYPIGEYGNLHERLDRFLKDDELRKRRVELGREIVLNNDTWDERAELIVTTLTYCDNPAKIFSNLV